MRPAGCFAALWIQSKVQDERVSLLYKIVDFLFSVCISCATHALEYVIEAISTCFAKTPSFQSDSLPFGQHSTSGITPITCWRRMVIEDASRDRDIMTRDERFVVWNVKFYSC